MVTMTCRAYVNPDHALVRHDYPEGEHFDFVDRRPDPKWCVATATRYLEWRVTKPGPAPDPMASFVCDTHATAIRNSVAASHGGMVMLRDLAPDDPYAQHQARNWDRL